MSVIDQQPGSAEGGSKTGVSQLFELPDIDPSAPLADKTVLEQVIPHRGAMLLLDSILWSDDNYREAIGYRRVREDEFWVEGHFPGQPLMPGVVQVESAAQLACWMFNMRMEVPQVSAFLRIEDCAFRNAVVPGDEFMVLAREIKRGKRRFITQVQGLVAGQVTFEAQINGMAMGDAIMAE